MRRSRAYFLTTARLGFDRWTDNDLELANAPWGDQRVTALIGGASRHVLAELGFRLTHGELYNPTLLMHRSFLLQRGELV